MTTVQLIFYLFIFACSCNGLDLLIQNYSTCELGNLHAITPLIENEGLHSYVVSISSSLVTNRQADRQLIYCSYCLSIWQEDSLCAHVYVCAFTRHCVCMCGIRQQYQLQSVVHFAPTSPNNHSHLILRASLSFLSFFHPQLLVLTGYSRDQSEGSEYSKRP